MNKTLLAVLMTTLLAFQVKAEDNKATWLVDIGDAVSLTAHICTLPCPQPLNLSLVKKPRSSKGRFLFLPKLFCKWGDGSL